MQNVMEEDANGRNGERERKKRAHQQRLCVYYIYSLCDIAQEWRIKPKDGKDGRMNEKKIDSLFNSFGIICSNIVNDKPKAHFALTRLAHIHTNKYINIMNTRVSAHTHTPSSELSRFESCE